jgi:hypothetical protein
LIAEKSEVVEKSAVVEKEEAEDHDFAPVPRPAAKAKVKAKAAAKASAKRKARDPPPPPVNEQTGGSSSSSSGSKRKRRESTGEEKNEKKRRRTQRVLFAEPREAEILHLFNTTAFGPDYSGDEEIVSVDVFITLKEALSSPEEPKWREAISAEVSKVEAYETWGPPLEEQQIRDYLNAGTPLVPAAIVLTKKRDGRYKARLCALGDRVSGDYGFQIDAYQSTVSASASRYLLTTAASSGYFISLFDIQNAYLHAELDKDMLIKLPDSVYEANKDQIRLLKKALYGLTQSGRLWGKKLDAALKKRGWEACEGEPGLYRKKSKTGEYMLLSVYVDDCCAAGPDKGELDKHVDDILDEFPGKPIPVVEHVENGIVYEKRDLCGVDFLYSREYKELHISMSAYTDKLFKTTFKADADKVKIPTSPTFSEKTLVQHQNEARENPNFEPEEFPIRQLIGGLLWATTQARPDLAAPVHFLARVVGKGPLTKGIVNAAKKVLGYMWVTRDKGISYTPQKEAAFAKTYGDLLRKAGAEQVLSDWNLFNDASFATCAVTLRSISGSVLYYRGTPIAWRSSRQTVRAYSTAESEYIAASDGLVFSRTQSFLDFFKPLDKKEPLIWCDNVSAIAIAGTEKDQLRPKTRHFALRLERVRDEASRLVFCPTTLQKADALTKNASPEQRELVFFFNVDFKVLGGLARNDEDMGDSGDFNLFFISEF